MIQATNLNDSVDLMANGKNSIKKGIKCIMLIVMTLHMSITCTYQEHPMFPFEITNQLYVIISKHFSVWSTIKVSRTMIIPNVDVLISFSLDIKLAEYWADETIVEKRRPWLNLPQQVWHLIVIS